MSNQTTIIDQILSTQSAKEAVANAVLDAESPASLFGRHASASSALTWGYYGGTLSVDGVLTQIANGTLSLTASSTCYVEVDRTGTVSFNTTAFTAGRIPLYQVTTGSATVTNYLDYRCWGANPRVTGRLSLSVAGSANVTLTRAQAANDILEFTGALTGNIQVIVPLAIDEWAVYNNTSGAYTLTVIGASGSGVAVTQGQRAILYSDGTNVVQIVAGAPAGMTNPMTTAGDLIDGGSSGTPQRLAIGSTGYVLTVVSGAPAWAAAGGGAAMPINAQTASYHPVLGDAPSSSNYQGIVTMNVGSANNVTIDPHSTTAWVVGTVLMVIQLGAGQTAFVAGAGVTLANPSSLTARAQNSTIFATNIATDSWIIGGDLT